LKFRSQFAESVPELMALSARFRAGFARVNRSTEDDEDTVAPAKASTRTAKCVLGPGRPEWTKKVVFAGRSGETGPPEAATTRKPSSLPELSSHCQLMAVVEIAVPTKELGAWRPEDRKIPKTVAGPEDT
jgi:hypothetical protein